MDSSQINRAAAPYQKKYKPVIDRIVAELKKNGYSNVKGYMDYGEKGHISLQFTINSLWK